MRTFVVCSSVGCLPTAPVSVGNNHSCEKASSPPTSLSWTAVYSSLVVVMLHVSTVWRVSRHNDGRQFRPLSQWGAENRRPQIGNGPDAVDRTAYVPLFVPQSGFVESSGAKPYDNTTCCAALYIMVHPENSVQLFLCDLSYDTSSLTLKVLAVVMTTCTCPGGDSFCKDDHMLRNFDIISDDESI